jgi:site-specific recombinase XerD
MPPIKSKLYRQFLDDGLISLIGPDKLAKALDNVTGKYKQQGRALLICLYLTGARPNECLNLKAHEVKKEDSYIVIQMSGSKRGLPRPIYLQSKNPLVQELFKYAMGVFPDQYLFYDYRSDYTRVTMTKEGPKERHEITDSLRYHFKKWFKGVLDSDIPPYFLRHNRFSKLAEAGASDNELMQLKGSRTMDSIQSYKHMSSKSGKSTAKKID